MQPRSAESVRRWSQRVCAGAFLLVVFAPLVDQLVRPSSARDSLQELRIPSPRPRLTLDVHELEAFPAAFEAWHGDTFGLRDVLLRWHNVLRWYGLHTSPTDSIALGQDGWIFLRMRGLLEDHHGTLPMPQLELEQWRIFLERRRDWLAERGITYVLVLVPDKSEIYPERVPRRYAPVGPTRMDQLVEYLRTRSDVEPLELLDVLREERRNDQGDDVTFYPLGVHWTDRGAYAAYAALIERLARTRPGLTALPREAFVVERETKEGDNWGERLYMRDLLTQAYLMWTVREPAALEVDVPDHGRTAVYERPDASALPTALLMHDSFGLPLRPWLAEGLSRLDCRWTTRFDADEIDRTRPDFVIQLCSEFTLIPLMPQSTALEDEGATRARFEASHEVLWRLEDLRDTSTLRSGSSLTLVDGTLRIERHAADEQLFLPEITFPRDRTVLLLAEIEAPEDDWLHLLYQTPRERTYDRNRATEAVLQAGRSSICLVLPPRDYAGRLDLLIGTKPGSYTLHRLELRVEDR